MKAAVVGCGGIARVHAESIKKTNGKDELVAFCDIRRERAENFSKNYTDGKAPVFESLEEMLKAVDFDVLHICTPHALHVPMAVAGLKSGRNVFMEKPPAISKEQFQELKAAEKESGKLLGVCFQNRYNTSVTQTKEIISRGRAGKIVSARAFVTWSRGESYYKDSGWRGTLALEGGGVMINQSIHTLDLMTEFMGKPVSAEASIANHHLKGVIEVEDTMEAYIQYENGIGLFYCTTAFGSNAPIILEIHCEKMILRIEGDTLTLIYPDGRREAVDCEERVALGKDYWGTGHFACISNFYECVQSGKPAPIGIPQVERTFTLMMDLYDSARGQKN